MKLSSIGGVSTFGVFEIGLNTCGSTIILASMAEVFFGLIISKDSISPIKFKLQFDGKHIIQLKYGKG